MEKMIIDKGKVRNCPSNWAKMTWYQYGWYFGIRHTCHSYRDYCWWGVKNIGIGTYNVIMSILFFVPTLIIGPVLWSRQVRRARKNM